jgi:hypothetical protein
MTLCEYDFFDARNTWFWNEEYGAICYGIEKDGKLINTTGIYISTEYGVVYISRWNANGKATKPMIRCNADGIL